MKKIVSSLMSLSMLLAGVAAPVESTVQTVMTAYASSFSGSAMALTLGKLSSDVNFTKTNSSACFSFTVSSAMTVSLYTEFNLSLGVTLYDSNDNVVTSYDLTQTVGNEDSDYHYAQVTAGTYYLYYSRKNSTQNGFLAAKVSQSSASIKDINSTDITVTLPKSVYEYTGSSITPEPTVKDGTKTLTKNTDYTVSYENNKNLGSNYADNTSAAVVIKGTGSYQGTRRVYFTITRATSVNITSTTISGVASTYDYTGSAIKPTVTVKYNNTTLTLGTDYTVSYGTNISGSGTVTVKGTGSYTGSKTLTFTIHTHTFDSGVVTTAPTLTSKGVRTYTCTGCGATKTEEIAALININGASVSGVNDSYSYTGSAIKPAVTVKYNNKTLTQGTDYTVSYGTNVSGTGSVTITGIGLYGGTNTVSFTIEKTSGTRLAGDVDGNGKVDINDLTTLQKYIAGWGVSINTSNADIDGASGITLSDLTLLQKKLAGWSVTLK